MNPRLVAVMDRADTPVRPFGANRKPVGTHGDWWIAGGIAVVLAIAVGAFPRMLVQREATKRTHEIVARDSAIAASFRQDFLAQHERTQQMLKDVLRQEADLKASLVAIQRQLDAGGR